MSSSNQGPKRTLSNCSINASGVDLGYYNYRLLFNPYIYFVIDHKPTYNDILRNQ